MATKMMDTMKVLLCPFLKNAMIQFLQHLFKVIYPVDYKQTSHIVDDEMHMIMVRVLCNCRFFILPV